MPNAVPPWEYRRRGRFGEPFRMKHVVDATYPLTFLEWGAGLLSLTLPRPLAPSISYAGA